MAGEYLNLYNSVYADGATGEYPNTDLWRRQHSMARSSDRRLTRSRTAGKFCQFVLTKKNNFLLSIVAMSSMHRILLIFEA